MSDAETVDRRDPASGDRAETAPSDRPTRRWRGISAVALIALGTGVLATRPALVLASAVALAAAGYGRISAPPTLDVSVDRTVSDRRPDPGDEVTVTVTVRNEGADALVDLRVVDGVPGRLSVVDGSPRLGTALRAGETATFTYAVEARRGGHQFEPATVVARDLAGATERVTSVAERGELTCTPALGAPTVEFPLRAQTSPFTGRFPADEGGPGVEFYATREYESGDPLNRIDWRRTARSGDLTTVEYKVERTARVVLVVDARQLAYAAPDPRGRPAIEYAIDAARDVAASLLADGHEVGVAVVGPTDCWLAPGRGQRHRVELRETLGAHPALGPVEPADGTNVYAASQRLLQRVSADTQLVVFSPLTAPTLAGTIGRWDARGHRATVVSPDPTATESVGQRVAAVERKNAIDDLRRRGIPVVDWDPDEATFPAAIAGLAGRWSP